MAEEAQNNEWPLQKFYFTLDWGSLTNIPFQEVSGLDIEAQPINYKHGNSPVFSEITMPGLIKKSSVIMKKGLSADDNIFWDWYNTIKTNTIQRQNIVIKLIDEAGNPMMTWTLQNAWPISITTTELEHEGSGVAIEIIEIQHEGLTIN
jgi:phage tail-like protein